MSNIKINDVPQRIQYSATGGQTQFTIPFPFFSNSYVYVWLNGIQIFQGGAPGQYVVTGAGSPSGGLVTFNTAATLDDIVTIEGIMPIDRTSIYSATISNLTGSDLNGDFNREVVMLQQLNTTQSFMQLQYAPWEEVSQDLTVTTDRYIPLLPAGYGWRKNAAGTAIEAIAIPEGGFAPQIGSFVTISDERSDLPNSFPLFDLGNSSTGGMGIPAGTTAQRVVPSAPNISLRFNTDLGYIEAYIGGNWVEIPSGAAGLFLPLAGGTMSGNIDMNSNIIEGLSIPILGSEAANKDYVDSQIGVSGTVTAASINEIAFYPANGDTVDGIPTANSAVFCTDATGIPGWSASLTDGQLLIGDTSGTPVAATLTAGPGISISNSAGGITIAGTGSGIGWTEVTGTTQAMVADNGYVANNGTLVVFTLPATAAFGAVINLVGKGAGGWRIDQNASQNIQVGLVSSTVGIGGSVASTNRYDSIELLCTTANTTWTVLGGPQGNLTIV